MQAVWSILQATRANVLALAQSLAPDLLQVVPPGFNNHLLWNLGHIVVTQQVLCYELCGLAPRIDPALIARYRKGTRPTGPVSPEEVMTLFDLLPLTPAQVRADYEAGRLQGFRPYETSFGYRLSSIEDALHFNNVHEGLHLGYMMAQKRALQG